MTPDRSYNDTAGRAANKVRVEGCEAPFNPYFYVPKYRSDALPVPEIFVIEFCSNFSDLFIYSKFLTYSKTFIKIFHLYANFLKFFKSFSKTYLKLRNFSKFHSIFAFILFPKFQFSNSARVGEGNDAKRGHRIAKFSKLRCSKLGARL